MTRLYSSSRKLAAISLVAGTLSCCKPPCVLSPLTHRPPSNAVAFGEKKRGFAVALDLPEGTEYSVRAHGKIRTDQPTFNSPNPYWIELRVKSEGGCQSDVVGISKGSVDGYEFDITMSGCRSAGKQDSVFLYAERCTVGNCVVDSAFEIAVIPKAELCK